MPGRVGWKLRSIAHDFNEAHLGALVYDMSLIPKMVFPWPGTPEDPQADAFAGDRSALLLLLGFIPRVGLPSFTYKTSREIDVSLKILKSSLLKYF